MAAAVLFAESGGDVGMMGRTKSKLDDVVKEVKGPVGGGLPPTRASFRLKKT